VIYFRRKLFRFYEKKKFLRNAIENFFLKEKIESHKPEVITEKSLKTETGSRKEAFERVF